MLYVEDIRSYIRSKIENIGDEKICKDLETMCNGDLSLKLEYAHMIELNLVKYMFYIVFKN